TPPHLAKVGARAAISPAWTPSASARPEGAFRRGPAGPDSSSELSRGAAAGAEGDPEGPVRATPGSRGARDWGGPAGARAAEAPANGDGEREADATVIRQAGVGAGEGSPKPDRWEE